MDIIAWTDVETTGVEYGDELLEVACLITDEKFNLLDEEGYQAVVKYSAEEVEAMKAKVNPFVFDMHSTSGLWDKLVDGVPKSTVDFEMLEYVARFEPESKKARMAGNSIRLDLNAAQAHLPLFYSHIHYRSLDVTAFATLAHWNGVPYFQKQKKHEALEDIKESLAEMKYLSQHMRFSV